ncbi:siderophore-interacting protein [Embleya hyalina]|uniref:Siderophore-interacting protein n=1 Tax=Embleya hyalina TaxID=516124 RepID=A0A401YVY6_9ACTN|nr:siderophore-interacting protein [Embleya hyalina]GCD98782.1 siderophore-interacting protein [Embleya hyalina]
MSPGTNRRRGPMNRLLDRVFLSGTIVETEPIAARMRRIRIEDAGLRGVSCRPGQQVRVHVNDVLSMAGWRKGVGNLLRTYSVWANDPTAGTLDLCVLDHDGGPGPGAAWGRAARCGDRVRFGRPEGGFVLRADAPYHVFVGEETASVALGSMLASVGSGADVYGVIETASAADRLPTPHAERLTWLERGDASAASSTTLAEAVGRLALPATPGVAYVAGEARTVKLVRDRLVAEHGWDRRSVLTKPFWSPGRTGME